MTATPRRIGVFVCHCGGNISDYVEVDRVAAAVASEPGVIVAKTHTFTCSDAAQQDMIDDIRNEKLDGLVIASCSPKLHLFTFRGMAERAGINPYRYVHVNLREQCSWAHTDDPEGATRKGVALVRAGVAKAALSLPLTALRVKTTPRVLVIGGGVVGFNAAQMAVGLGADVTILDRDPEVLERLGTHFESRAKTRFSNRANIEQMICEAELVIGAVLIPGAAAPKLVTREMLKCMKPGAVLVDVAIDQGGCFETSRATTHADPTYVVDGVVHYCVANMPGAVARTSTYALNNVTLPHALRIADMGWQGALKANPHLANGLNVHAGQVTYEAVARELGYPYVPVAEVLG